MVLRKKLEQWETREAPGVPGRTHSTSVFGAIPAPEMIVILQFSGSQMESTSILFFDGRHFCWEPLPVATSDKPAPTIA